jgi:2,5-diketo-D-gluconate reductase A
MAHGITTGAWSPLGRGQVLDNPTIGQIAQRYGVSPAQVVIRWHLQRGDVVIPKSATPSRITSNANVFGFALSDGDMSEITALNRNHRTGTHPDHENRTDR